MHNALGQGKPTVAHTAPAAGSVLDRTVTIRFDGNVMPGLPWKFEPEQTSMTVRIGEVVTALYKVTNQSARETYAQAGYNVSPPTVGIYFQKINCFCFTEQTMKPGETREMPVVFYVDPKLAADAEHDGLNTITLSYTFFPQREAPRPVRLFRRPEPLENVVALTPDDPPTQFRWRGQLHRVRRAEGPERVAEEWWKREIETVSTGHVRDYYRVELDSGARLWVCRAGPMGAEARWVLHGHLP